MSLCRIGSDRKPEQRIDTVPIDIYLSDLQNERDCIISRLRHIDKVLVQHGKLKNETIPRRIR